MEEAEKAIERGTEAYIKTDFTEAISHYERALDIDSENHIHWGNLSAVMFKVQAFKEVCTDNNQSPSIIQNFQCIWLCSLAIKMGHPEESL